MGHANMLHSVKPVIKPLPFLCLCDDPVTKYLIKTALNEFHTEDAKALPDSNDKAMYMYTLQKHVTKHQIQH